MIKFDIDTASLAAAAQKWRKMGVPIRKAAAAGLNQMGANVVDTITSSFAKDTGMAAPTISSLIRQRLATEEKLEWLGDFSDLRTVKIPPKRFVPRSWQSRNNSMFQDEQMVNVVTMRDDKVCQFCQELADNGPYPLSVAQGFIPRHPRCRCVLVPDSGDSRIVFPQPIQPIDILSMPTQTLSPSQLAQHIVNQVILALRAR